MEAAKITARFLDGRIKKGYSQDFFPNKPVFHLLEDSKKISVEPEELRVSELKALFFVKDFAGNPKYEERKKFEEGDKSTGRKVEVTFADGERMQGSVLGYNPQQPGFFLFPVDPDSNNDRVFVVNASVKSFQYI